MATEQNRRDADETGTFLDDTASLKDTGFLDDTDVLSSDTFEEESFLDDDVPEGEITLPVRTILLPRRGRVNSKAEKMTMRKILPRTPI